jgi:hypothetical protein
MAEAYEVYRVAARGERNNAIVLISCTLLCFSRAYNAIPQKIKVARVFFVPL